jgi:phosphate transport system permease protein
MLVGTYLAEYANELRLRQRRPLRLGHPAVSAPSIIVGLFVYGSFWCCRWAASPARRALAALAIIIIPVVVRTTEDMLTLIPNTLREAVIGARRAALEDDRHACLLCGPPFPASSPACCWAWRA